MATGVDPVACPPNRRTWNPDGSRIRAQTEEEKAEEERVFEKERKRWGDRVGRRPTPPPSPAPEESTTDTDTSSQDPMLQPQHDDRKGGLLARVFHRGEKKEKKKDAYIAAAASWGGERDGEVRRERLGRRD